MESHDHKLIRKCGIDWAYCNGVCHECEKAHWMAYDYTTAHPICYPKPKVVEIDLKDLFPDFKKELKNDS